MDLTITQKERFFGMNLKSSEEYGKINGSLLVISMFVDTRVKDITS